MLGKNMRQNLQMVVQIATAYSDQIGAESLMEMLESFKLYEGLFYYLGAIVNSSTVRLLAWDIIGVEGGEGGGGVMSPLFSNGSSCTGMTPALEVGT